MTQAAESATTAPPGVQWKRAGALFVICMIAVGVLAVGLIVGVIPIQMALGKNPFQLTVDRVSGDNMTAFVSNSPNVEGGTDAGVILDAKSATVDNLCLSTVLALPLVDHLSIIITSGASESIPVHKLHAFTPHLEIDSVVVNDVELGRDAATLDRNDLVDGPRGAFGVQYRSVENVTNLKAEGQYIKVLSIQLRGLGLKLKTGEHNCAD